jgi:hypothetical protein
MNMKASQYAVLIQLRDAMRQAMRMDVMPLVAINVTERDTVADFFSAVEKTARDSLDESGVQMRANYARYVEKCRTGGVIPEGFTSWSKGQ